jgi:ABC-type dipeptide/oligopeptide/nickel transport system permease subunit
MADKWVWIPRVLALLPIVLRPGISWALLRAFDGGTLILAAGCAAFVLFPYSKIPQWLSTWAGRFGAGVFGLLLFGAVYAPLLSPNDPNTQFQPTVCRYLKPMSRAWLNAADGKVFREPAEGLKPLKFPLGTDAYGRCVFSRVLAGARISLAIGLLSVLLTLLLGFTVGCASGYLGGFWDAVMMRGVDTLLAFPRLFLLLLLAGILEKSLSIFGIVLILGGLSWMEVSRLVRGQVLSLKERDFILSAKAIGASTFRILTRHVFPHLKGLLLIDATLRIGGIILTEAALSFLGLGVQPPNSSWGNIIADGKEALTDGWWVATFPGLAMLATVFSLYLIGEAAMKDVE